MTTNQSCFLSSPLFKLRAWSAILLILGGLLLQPYLSVAAADVTVIAIAGGSGAELWNATDGALVQHVAPGERLTGWKRSADGLWLYVETATGDKGWASVEQLLVAVNAETLPAEAVTITPVEPAAEPTAPQAADSQPQTTNAQSAQSATPMGASPTVSVLTHNARLNIRSGPGLDYPVISKAVANQAYTAHGRNEVGDWISIDLPALAGGLGWVSAQYIEADAPLLDLAVVAEVNTVAPVAPVVMAPPVVPAQTAPAAPTGLQGNLVIQASYGGPIYLYQLATGQLRQLSYGFDPAISPDGRQVVFTRDGGANGIYLINLDGSTERKIFGERELLRSPKWSPDGKWIVFVRSDEFTDCRVFEDGRCIREGVFPDRNPDAYPLGKERVAKLARVDVNGENYRDLAVMEHAMAPDWNSGGIVYQSAAGLQITADTPEDTNRKLFFQIRKQYHQDPDWQPGNGAVVFQQREGSHWEIYRLNPDGAGLMALTRPATALVPSLPSNVAPAWSPDGKQVVFLSNRTADNAAGAWHLWVMNADGSGQRQLPVSLTLTYGYVAEQVIDWGP